MWYLKFMNFKFSAFDICSLGQDIVCFFAGRVDVAILVISQVKAISPGLIKDTILSTSPPVSSKVTVFEPNYLLAPKYSFNKIEMNFLVARCFCLLLEEGPQ